MLVSSGGVSGANWDTSTLLLASLIRVAQFVKLLKLLLPFLKGKNELACTYFFCEEVHFQHEKFWNALEVRVYLILRTLLLRRLWLKIEFCEGLC